ncbi:WD40 repeat domain-containing protein [Streptomyces sp. NBC_01244]|uniref:WD40 repeat domain-containing protein n=1 Tax=Streptomyces sp. NBC_01244 TaxID=2903797 RepID=UPI002E0FA6F8|nr:repetative protein [Streptomyces sp. NBC_01244]
MRTINLPANPKGHAAPITHVALSTDGRRLASCSYDGTVLIWDTTDPTQPIQTTRLHHRRLVNASSWNPVDRALLATASADKSVAVWRIPDEGRADLVNVLARHTDDINSVAWMPDGERLICVSEDGRATLWNAHSGRFLAEVSSHAAHCMMVSVSPNGLVATVGEDGMVAVSDPDTHQSPTVRHYDSSIEGCAWSHSGKILAVACDNGTIDLLTDTLGHLRTIQVSNSAARTVDWTEDDATFVVGAYDGSLHFFDITGERTHQVYDARVWPRSVSVAKSVVAVGSFRGGPHLFDRATAKPLAAPDTVNHGPNAMVVLGRELFVGCDSGSVLAVDLDADLDTAAVRRLDLTDGPILSLAAHGTALYAGTYSGHVIRHEGGRTHISEQLGAPVPSLCSGGQTIVAGTYNGELIALDPRTLDVVDRRSAHQGSVKSLTALRTGFLSAATDRTVATGTFRERATLWEHGNLINAVAVLDDSIAATASRDHTVKVGRFEVDENGESQILNLQTLLGPDESVKCVGLLGTPDAPVVLAGSYDFALYQWRVDWHDSTRTLASGQVLAEFSQGLSCMCPLDGSRVAVAGWDGQIVVVGQDSDGQVRLQRTLHVNELAATARLQEKGVTA